MPTAKFIHDGDAIDYRPTTDVAAGDLVFILDLVGVAKRDIPANTLGALAMTGVFEIRVEDPTTVAQGNPLYWNTTDKWAENDSNMGNYPRLGVAVSAPYERDSVAWVLLRLNH